MRSHEPLAVARVRAVSRTRGDDLAVSGSAGSEPGLGSPRLLPVPSAWWETPAVTSRVLLAHPESAGTARHFTREILSSWGMDRLVDEAETIVGELVVNAVQHGTPNPAINGRAGGPPGRGGNGYPRPGRSRPAWAAHLTDAAPPMPPWRGETSGETRETAAGEPEADLLDARRPGIGRLDRRGADGAVLRLCLLRRAGEVMLAVIDASDDAPTPRQPDWAKESGRGLQIVNALASVWGWSPIEGRGKAVWAVLPYQLSARRGLRLSRGVLDRHEHVLHQADQHFLGRFPAARVTEHHR